MKKLLALLLFMTLITATALAETTLTGTVVSGGTVTVLAPAEGTLASVDVQPGDRVQAGDSIASLATTTIYANEAGTVRIYGAEGAALESINEQYGAVLYILPDAIYTLSASTSNAYSAEANKRVIPGEKVYLRATESAARAGTGIVTGVSSSNYLVEVVTGDFNSSESVYIYRDSNFDATSRIGKGTISYTGAVGYTGTGEDVSIAASSSSSSGMRGMGSSSSTETTTETVADDSATPQSLVKVLVYEGQHVSPGTPLFTVSVAGAYAQEMNSPASGVVTEVAVTAGSAVTPGMAIATIAPDGMMRLALHVPENKLSSVALGSTVTIRFLSGETAEGTVLSLQGLAETADDTEDADDEEAYFTVYVSFPATSTIAYGMTGKVTVGE